MVKNVNSNELSEILKNDMVLVDFFAKWCGPCKMISPIIENISNEINDVTFVKIDIDENSQLANSYNIMSIPTLLLFKNGKIVDKSVGFISKQEIISFIEKNK